MLLPVHNCALHVRAAIDSILAQKYREFELVVIDDGSTDGSSEIVNSYCDSRVKVIHNDSNLGLPRALNIGAAQAVGRYFARQDADDISSKDRFQLQTELLDHNSSVGVVGSWWEWMDVNGETYAVSRPDSEIDGLKRTLLNGGVPVPHGSMMLRREVFEDLQGYDSRFWFSQDYDLWLRLLSTDWQIGIVEKPLYKLRMSPIYTSYKQLCQKRFSEIALNQYHSRQRLEFDDVLEEVRSRNPDCLRRIPHAEAAYWNELGNSALSTLQGRTVACTYFKRGLEDRKSIAAFVGLLLAFAPHWFVRSSMQTWRLAKRLLSRGYNR